MTEITEEQLRIDVKNYLRTSKVFDFVARFLKVNIRLHEENDIIENGDIFVFNHFSRFETFIPQYLIFKRTGAFSRPIAVADLFEEGPLANYLLSMGAIPHNYPDIINFLTCEINHSVKAIVFPEGGMIKDKSVTEQFGLYKVYSREKRVKMRPRTGAAVIALRVETCRFLYRLALEKQDKKRMELYSLCFPKEEQSGDIPRYLRPTQIVPATITYYPLRISENLLKFLAEHIGSKKQRWIEEMAIEGNFLTKNTDMDIYMSKPIDVHSMFTLFDIAMLKLMYLFNVTPGTDPSSSPSLPIKLIANLYEGRVRLLAKRLTHKFMSQIYSNVTVNLTHIASLLIFYYITKKNVFNIKKETFFKQLFCVIKELQNEENVILHPHLNEPEQHGSLLKGKNDLFDEFLLMAQEEELVTVTDETFSFSPKLLEKYEFDSIRIKNTLKVLYNEVKPIKEMKKVLGRVVNNFSDYEKNRLPGYLFDDDLKIYQKDKEKYLGPEYDEINERETKTLSGEPFFLESQVSKNNKTGILLFHGFPASPAEMKPLGNFLHKNGFTVYGVRLKGHGTSPHDLDETPFNDCIESIERGYKALSLSCEKVVVIGFSAGAVIALDLAGQLRENICGVISISASIIVEGMDDFALNLSAQVEKVAKLIPGVKSKFIDWGTESPDVNYRSVPLQKLADLKSYIGKVKEKLGKISVPLLIVQADRDPLVKKESAELIYKTVSSENKQIFWYKSDKHNIVKEESIEVYNNILSFIKENH